MRIRIYAIAEISFISRTPISTIDSSRLEEPNRNSICGRALEKKMELASFELAGFFAAHAIWCVSEAPALTPMIGFAPSDGKAALKRFASEKIEQGVEIGRREFESNPIGAIRAVFLYDGYLHLPEGKTDSLLLEIAEYQPETSRAKMAVPYRNISERKGFAVYRPKFLELPEKKNKKNKMMIHTFHSRINGHSKDPKIQRKYYKTKPQPHIRHVGRNSENI
jgi:hypothetical protein